DVPHPHGLRRIALFFGDCVAPAPADRAADRRDRHPLGRTAGPASRAAASAGRIVEGRGEARRVTSTRRISPAWLAAAGVVFAADILLHLPVTDICDDLVKRF